MTLSDADFLGDVAENVEVDKFHYQMNIWSHLGLQLRPGILRKLKSFLTPRQQMQRRKPLVK